MSVVIPIVVAYNKLKYLIRCLDSLERQNLASYICVVNNGCCKEIENMLVSRGVVKPKKSDSFMSVQLNRNNNKKYIYIKFAENIGTSAFSKAVSFLISETNFDYFYFVDDDAYLNDNCLENLEKYFYNEDVIVSLKLSDSDNNLLDNHVGFVKTDLSFPFVSITSYLKSNKEFPIYVTNSALTGIAVSRRVVNDIGCIREDFFLKAEDYDYCIRLTKYGYKMRLASDSVMYHPRKIYTLRSLLFYVRNMAEVCRIHGIMHRESVNIFIDKFSASISRALDINVSDLYKALSHPCKASSEYILNIKGIDGTLEYKYVNFSSVDLNKLRKANKVFCLGSSSFCLSVSRLLGKEIHGIYIEHPTPMHSISLGDFAIKSYDFGNSEWFVIVQLHPIYIMKALALIGHCSVVSDHIIFQAPEIIK